MLHTDPLRLASLATQFPAQSQPTPTHRVAVGGGPDAALLADNGGLGDLASGNEVVVDVRCGIVSSDAPPLKCETRQHANWQGKEGVGGVDGRIGQKGASQYRASSAPGEQQL